MPQSLEPDLIDQGPGRVIGVCLPKHRRGEFLRFLKIIDAEAPRDRPDGQPMAKAAPPHPAAVAGFGLGGG